MDVRIRDRVEKTLFLLTLLVAVVPFLAGAQNAGDIAIIGYNADANDEFAFVSFIDIPSGQTIYFSERDWDGSTFNSEEGTITYTAPSGGITAGDVIIINPNNATASDGGTISVDGSYRFAAGGDVIYAYLGTGIDSPTTWLFAITHNTSWASADGVLTNTGLTEGTTALSGIGGSIDDNGEYSGTREGTIASLKEEIQKVDTEWRTTDGSGDQAITFDQTAFTLVEPPTIAFSTSSMSANEDDGSVNLSVELVEANGTDTDVDVVFLSSSSSANNSDIGSYSTTNVSFGSGASSGDSKTIPINLNSNDGFEGAESAVFQLQNISTGSIIEPNIFNLTINDGASDAPQIVINEVHADPADGIEGDADGNAERNTYHDEFVEFVNNQSVDIDISNWKFYNESDLKHTFPEGTVISASGALVLFGDDGVSPEGGFGGAIVQSTNEAESLRLVNGGDTISLEDDNGNEIISLTYTDADINQSITRNPDISGDFEDHSSAAADNSLFSPGTKLDGTAFGSNYAVGIRGNEGWRMISTPTSNTTFNELFGDFWMQGINGSDAASESSTIYSWSEADGGSFVTPTGMDQTLTAGKGYIVYFFEDDKFNTPGIQGGFPKVVNTNKSENSSVSVNVTSTDADESGSIDGTEGWNLLGNPFGTDISVDVLFTALESFNTNVQNNIRVWDPAADNGNGDYIIYEKGDGERLAPFQAFWVKFTQDGIDGNVSFNRSNLAANTGTQFYKEKTSASDEFEISLSLSDGEYYDNYYVEFSDNGMVELDRYDAYKLFSLNPDAINFYSTFQDNKLLKNALPRDMETALEIPLGFDAPGRESLNFSWQGIDRLPDGWNVVLKDIRLNKEVNLATVEKYEFTRTLEQAKQKAGKSGNPELGKTKSGNGNSRFVLSIIPAGARQTQNAELPETVKLNQNYPNPFNPSTTISFELKEQAHVKLNVYTIVGQKVATLVDEVRDAGTHDESWNAADLPSGIYIAQLEVQGRVFIRKMTLIK